MILCTHCSRPVFRLKGETRKICDECRQTNRKIKQATLKATPEQRVKKKLSDQRYWKGPGRDGRREAKRRWKARHHGWVPCSCGGTRSPTAKQCIKCYREKTLPTQLESIRPKRGKA